MRQQKQVHWSVILAIVLIALVALHLFSSRTTGYSLQPSLSRPQNGLNGYSWGNPKYPAGGPYCVGGGSGISCKDAKGNIVPYQCGDVFRVYSSALKTTETCMVGVTCDDVDKAANADMKYYCSKIPECSTPIPTGGFVIGFCTVVSDRQADNYCSVELFGKCV